MCVLGEEGKGPTEWGVIGMGGGGCIDGFHSIFHHRN